MENLGINMAATMAADSFYVGGNWGFLLDENPESDDIINLLDKHGIKRIMLSNGYIVFCDYEYLKNVIARIEPLTEDAINKHRTRLQREIPELQKLLTSILRDSCKYVENCGQYYEINIGLYCVNNMHKMRINGVEYPAFTLTLSEALKEILKLHTRLPMYIYTSRGFEKMGNAVSTNIEGIYSGLDIASSGTGAFLTLRFTRGRVIHG